MRCAHGSTISKSTRLKKLQSLEREEPGIRFDVKEQALDMCWTGEVGRSFQARLTEAFQALGPLTEYASEITLTSYHDSGKEEFQQIFIGPSAEAIHEIRRQCVEEDLGALLSPHFDKTRVDQVANMVNQMFDDEWKRRPWRKTRRLRLRPAAASAQPAFALEKIRPSAAEAQRTQRNSKATGFNYLVLDSLGLFAAIVVRSTYEQ